MTYRMVQDPHNDYWNIVTVENDDAVAMVWEKDDAERFVAALNSVRPEAGGTSFTTVEFCGKPAAAPCAIEEQCQYGKDRDMVIEECAKVCESRAGSQAMAAFRILTSAADAIRGLKSREPQQQRIQEDK